MNGWGLPAGQALAWTITVVEIVGGAVLAAGYLVRPLTAWFGVQLAMGIYLIHASAGWSVMRLTTRILYSFAAGRITD